MKAPLLFILAAALAVASPLAGQGYTREQCRSCAEWNEPRRALRIFGNTYYVGTQGLGAVLVTSSQGHVLIDGALPESAPHILANIRRLGFRVQDVKLILNSHAHFDHAGGLAALQRASGATVAASPASAPVLERGASGPDDPQYGPGLLAFPAVSRVRVIADGDTLRVGPLALTAHLTPGHTPGGTTWTWRSCERGRCLDMVYADSQTPISAEGFRFTSNPAVLQGFERGLATLERLRCDVLITPHPQASRLWERVASRGLVDRNACRRYAATSREQLARRLADERGTETN
ncbi:MAG TPA: subclass B3 metallo-beta-lactamase [Longimicrobium sp.]|jgi:metallo-beta-lactamase class B